MSIHEILRLLGCDTPSSNPRELLRAVLTVRPPGPLPPRVAPLLDDLLAAERIEVEPDGPVWLGDITTLKVDAIVNAANSALLGCFRPLHPCVDNAIHSAAGPGLREECHRVMTAQGTPEPTGRAKLTGGYHLPARYVLHTVGPVVDGPLASRHERALVSAYTSCLDLAATVPDLRTLAFCAISTGVFGYPKAAAARTAVSTVDAWQAGHPGRFEQIVFTVFTPEDQAIYQGLLP